MSEHDSEDARLDRRSYLSGSLAALSTLSVSSVPTAADRATSVSGGQNTTEIDSCTTITDPGHYVLTTDLESSAGEACIEIRADDVLVDGDGHTICGSEDGTGVLAEPRADGPLTKVTVSNLTFENLAKAIVFDEIEKGLITAVDVQFNQPQGVGIRVVDCSDTVVQQSHVTGGGNGIGIELQRSASNAVLWNEVSSLVSGIALQHAHENQFVGNEISSITPNALTLNESHDNQLFGNSILGSNNSLAVIRSRGNVLASNTFRDGTEGLHFSDSTENAFVGNTVTDFLNGVMLHSSDENRLLGNVIEDVENHGLSVDDSHRNEIVGTELKNNGLEFGTGNGIVLQQSDYNQLVGTIATNNGGDGVTLLRSDCTVICGTTTKKNGAFGIGVFESSHTRARGNDATANGKGPVSIVGGSDNEIEVNGTIYTSPTSSGLPQRIQRL